jgi:hypothetical protein
VKRIENKEELQRLRNEFFSFYSEYGHQLDVPKPVAAYVEELEVRLKYLKYRYQETENEKNRLQNFQTRAQQNIEKYCTDRCEIPGECGYDCPLFILRYK